MQLLCQRCWWPCFCPTESEDLRGYKTRFFLRSQACLILRARAPLQEAHYVSSGSKVTVTATRRNLGLLISTALGLISRRHEQPPEVWQALQAHTLLMSVQQKHVLFCPTRGEVSTIKSQKAGSPMSTCVTDQRSCILLLPLRGGPRERQVSLQISCLPSEHTHSVARI